MNVKNISIAMAVYNGSKYVLQQLDSIRTQSLQPEEVIIIDDCSTDGSFDLIDEYIKNNKLKNWTIIEHKENKGYILTFWEAIKATKGEYIFLCDQDDIWMPNKIELMYKAIDAQKNCLVLCSNFEPFYESGAFHVRLLNFRHDIVNGLWRFSNIRNIFGVIRPGCTYCINRNILQYSSEYMLEFESHDAFFYRIALLSRGLFLYPGNMIKWRRHSKNASNRPVPYSKEIQYRQEDVEVALRNLTFYKNQIGSDADIINKLELFHKYCQLRAEFFEYHNIRHWIRMIPYFRYCENIWVILGDFQWIFRRNRDKRG